MKRLLRRLLDLLPAPAGVRMDRRLRTTGARHAQFVSFLESSGFRAHDVDRYELGLRRRRVARTSLLLALAGAVAWIVIESAHALTRF